MGSFPYTPILLDSGVLDLLFECMHVMSLHVRSICWAPDQLLMLITLPAGTACWGAGGAGDRGIRHRLLHLQVNTIYVCTWLNAFDDFRGTLSWQL